jgi:superfamily I DNA/RNA helicase
MIITHIKKTYVIFICLKDVFGKNLPIYTFNNICEQDHSLTLGDNANCFMGTFHGYCNMFLKEEIHRLTFPKTFTILDKKAELGRC